MINRRTFISLTGAAAALTAMPVSLGFGSEPKKSKLKKPDSRFGGVQIGAITYSWRSLPGNAEDTLKYCLQCGISSIELMGNTAEQFAGIPQPAFNGLVWMQRRSRWKHLRKLRRKIPRSSINGGLTAPISKYEDLRRMYNDAGVKIHIAKFSPENWSDEEIDYSFRAAKPWEREVYQRRSVRFQQKNSDLLPVNMACRSFCTSIFNLVSRDGLSRSSLTCRLTICLTLMQATILEPQVFIQNGIIEKLHNRIASVHIKDKTGPKGNPPNTNMEWGKGETPIKDILLLIRKNKWPITWISNLSTLYRKDLML